ncbi:hypothetical protein GCM10017687_34940 [Streptomyces echinatus]
MPGRGATAADATATRHGHPEPAARLRATGDDAWHRATVSRERRTGVRGPIMVAAPYGRVLRRAARAPTELGEAQHRARGCPREPLAYETEPMWSCRIVRGVRSGAAADGTATGAAPRGTASVRESPVPVVAAVGCPR